MANYSTNEFRSGLKVMLDGEPCSILDNEFVKPGKGQAFNRVRLRNLKTGRVWDRTFRSGETLEGADVMDKTMEYLYNDGEFWYFMEPDTFEQHQADAKAVGDSHLWLKEQDQCEVTLYNGAPLSVSPRTLLSWRLSRLTRASRAIPPAVAASQPSSAPVRWSRYRCSSARVRLFGWIPAVVSTRAAPASPELAA